MPTASEREAERGWARDRATAAGGWHLVYFGGRFYCDAIADTFGALDPGSLVAVLRRSDPGAYRVPAGRGAAWEVVIRTQGSSMRLVQGADKCAAFHNLVRPAPPRSPYRRTY